MSDELIDDFAIPDSQPKPSINFRKLTHNSIYNLAGQIVPGCVAFVALPFLIRGLGAERYGILSLSWSIISYFAFLDLGIGRALTKQVAELIGSGRQDESSHLIWTALPLVFGLGMVGSLIILPLSAWLAQKGLKIPAPLRGEAQISFALLSLVMPFVIMNTGVRGILESYQRFDLTNIVRISITIGMYVIPLFILRHTRHLSPIILSLVFIFILSCSWNLFFCFRIVPGLTFRPAPERKFVRPLVTFGGWLTVSSILSPLMIYLDRFLIGATLGSSSVTYYSIPFDFIIQFLLFAAAPTAVLFPLFATTSTYDIEQTRRYYVLGVKCVFFLMWGCSFLFIAFAPEFLRLWVGPTFARESATTLRILCLGLLFNGLAHVPFALIQGMGKPYWTARVHVFEFLIYLPLVIVLIRQFGIAGAAAAWALRVLADLALLLFLGNKLLPLKRSSRVKFLSALIFSFAVLLVASLLKILIYKIAFALIFLSLSCFMLFFSFRFTDPAYKI